MRFRTAELCACMALSCQPLAGQDVEGNQEPEEEFVEAMKAVGSGSIATRLRAAEAVANSDYEDNRASFAAVMDWMLSERDPWVRYVLAESLVESVGKDEQKALLMPHLEDPDPTLRTLCLSLVEDKPLPTSMEERLVRMWEVERYWWVKTELLPRLARGYGDVSLGAIHAGLQDSSPDVLEAAMEAAGKRSDPRSVTPLLDVMERALAWGLAAGPRALGILGDHDAIFALENALESPHEGVRAAAAAALAALRARKSTPLLVRLLEDPEPEVTQAVVSALIQLGAGEALPQILPHVALEDDLVDALAEMKGGDALETCFQQAAAEPKDEVRVRTMRLCEALRESRERSGTTQSIRLSCGLKRLGSLGSQVRIVAPHRNGQAEAWTPAPGVDRGGVTLRLKPGERVRVQGALLDGTEIWLKVIDEWWLKESVSTLSDGAWMRERDLEERNAAPREDAASRGHR